MSMIRWEPIRELMSLRQAMDRLFEERFVRPSPFLGLVGEAKKPAASSILVQGFGRSWLQILAETRLCNPQSVRPFTPPTK